MPINIRKLIKIECVSSPCLMTFCANCTAPIPEYLEFRFLVFDDRQNLMLIVDLHILI